MTDGLVQFLRDRLDEDYEVARLTLGPNVMARVRRGDPAPRWVPSPEGDAGIWDSDGTPRVKFVWARERDHIMRHDPARVLREVEAKRQLLALHEPGTQEYVDGDVCMACTLQGDGPYYPCATLRLLTLPYADHPDYRPEWRP
ncbi:DUF6221 family protein [Streptomyces sp. NBC_01789]|uniref:DUF6221 family protein n=1 Tax=Streptomyces sp. NBC_01789 TaxID=2975941 RepID=UPI002256E449|nr:DUF6221 family protein [Streptomyces sp. NBC_01789]MCX4450676.1 DUF6221 family protein [Streptomyces sp. NBC_01789]